MPIKRDRIDNLRIAAPCPVRWDEMRGDDRARFCEQCNRHVYNISELTRRQAEKLIVNTEGRICARLYKRADGTVITKDCPVGLRLIRRRAAKVAGAAVTAILSLCMSALGKTSAYVSLSRGTHFNLTHTGNGLRGQTNRGEISGRVVDPNHEPIEGASITITNQETGKKSKGKSKADGKFQFPMLAPGLYTIKIEADAFTPLEISGIELGANETIHEDFEITFPSVVLGIVVTEELPKNYQGPGATTIFSGDKARRLPF